MRALTYQVQPVRWVFRRLLGEVVPWVYYGPWAALQLHHDIPVPPLPGRRWVRLKTHLGGVCGTDVALIAQRVHPGSFLNLFSGFPAVLGHENVAVIEAVGDGVRDWQVGQRVCVEPAIGCQGREVEPCPECRAGRVAMCRHPGDERLPPRAMLGLNRTTGGSWGEYFVAHETQLHAVPGALPDEAAILVDPLASAAHAVMRRPPLPNERVLVSGSGVIGLGTIAAIRALGLGNEVSVLIRRPGRGQAATRLGANRQVLVPPRASTADRYQAVATSLGVARKAGRFGNQVLLDGYDLTYDCTGTAAGFTDALKWTRSRGTVVLVGTSGIGLVDTTPIWFNELSVLGANGRQVEVADGQSKHTYDLVFDWLRSGRLDWRAIPVIRYRLADYRRAFGDLLGRSRNVLKAVFEP